MGRSYFQNAFFGPTLCSIKPSPALLCNLLQRCIDQHTLSVGKIIHSFVLVNGLSSSTYVTTKLAQFYADCDDIAPAYHLLDRLPHPNVFACSSILAFHSRRGEHGSCFRCYGETKALGVVPDGYVFPVVVRACAGMRSLGCGSQVHGDVWKIGSVSVLQVGNSLVDFYSKCGCVRDARRVFDEMVDRNVLSWNSLISGYVCDGSFPDALKVLTAMRREGFDPDVVTWNLIIDGYCRIGRCEEALKIFRQIEMPNVITWTTMVVGFSRSDMHENALSIFREVMQGGNVSPDLDILSCVISSCRHLEATRQGRAIHGYGIRTNMQHGFYDSVGSALIAFYSNCNRIKDARVIFELMDHRDVVAWNAIISGFSQLGLGDLALNLFVSMQLSGIKYDQFTISTILPVCELKFGKQIHAHTLKHCCNLSVPLCNSLVSMYSKCGETRSAFFIFSNMQNKDIITWNTMIGGYGMNGFGHAALALLREMSQSPTMPNAVTITVTLSACSHLGLVDEGLNLFNSLGENYGIKPTIEHLSCVADVLARVGRLEDAYRFICSSPVTANARMWGSLLCSAQVHQNVEIAEAAADMLFRLEPENAGNFITLSNIYANANRWNDALRVRKLMKIVGVNKPAAHSSV